MYSTMQRLKLIYFTLWLGLSGYVSCYSQEKNPRLADSLEQVYKTSTTDTGKINVLIHLRNYYTDIDVNYAKAETYIKKALAISRRIDDKEYLFKVLGSYATLCANKLDLTGSLNKFIECISIAQELQDSLKLAKTYINLSNTYNLQGNISQSLFCLKKALNFISQQNHPELYSTCLLNLGVSYIALYKQKNTDSLFNLAEEHFFKCLKIAQLLLKKDSANISFIDLIYRAHNNLGFLYLEKYRKTGNIHHLNDAGEYLSTAKKMAIKIKNEYNINFVQVNMAQLFLEQKKYAEALQCLFEAEKYMLKIYSPEDLIEIYELYSRLYESTNKPAQALQYYKKADHLKDSIFSDTKNRQFSELQISFETEKKEKEIELLHKEKIASDSELLKLRLQKTNMLTISISVVVVILLVLILLLAILNRYKAKNKTAKLLLEQSNVIYQKNKEITDSIRYAKLIQDAVLTSEKDAKAIFPQSFVFYKPKDIVSGDFYWVEEWGSCLVYAVADCTGHGVPGALMSIVGNNLLYQAIHVYGLYRPHLILNYLNKNTAAVLNHSRGENVLRDGMDISLIMIDKKTRKLEYSGAYNDLWIIRNKALMEFKSDKFYIGSYMNNDKKSFNTHEITLEIGDVIYMFSDGYVDQFGGDNIQKRARGGKKFKYARLRELLLSIHNEDIDEQRKLVIEAHETWKGELEQVDDICITGIKITKNFFDNASNNSVNFL